MSRTNPIRVAAAAIVLAAVATPGLAQADPGGPDTTSAAPDRPSAPAPADSGGQDNGTDNADPPPPRKPRRDQARRAARVPASGSSPVRKPKRIPSPAPAAVAGPIGPAGPGATARSVPDIAISLAVDAPAAASIAPALREPQAAAPAAGPAATASPLSAPAAATSVVRSVVASLLGSPTGAPVESPVSWIMLAAARRQARAAQGRAVAATVGTTAFADPAAATGPSGSPAPAATVVTASDRAFWTAERGIGFSVGSQGALADQNRLESALKQVNALGFNTIRTWGTDAYTGRILEAVTRLNLPIKVQPGIYITKASDANAQIDAALAIIKPYADKVIGVSLGNEQLVDWNTTATLTVQNVIDEVAYFKSKSTLPVTYDFAGETFLPGASQWNQNLGGLLSKLDYISVHSYAGFFDNRNNPSWTPAKQLDALKSYESMLSAKLNALGLGSKPIVLGETGWQSTGYNPAVTNQAAMQQYYEGVTRYVYGADARYDGMFYFNFTDEAWKGGDNFWGLYGEGTSSAIGPAKFAVAPVTQILGSTTAAPSLQMVKVNGSVSLLKDPATGIAYVQSAGAAPLKITRADSYWSGAVPLTRGGATLVSAAVDGSGRLRVLDTSSYGQFGWVLDGSGKFTGEQKYDASTLPAAETLFAVDLNNDGRIGSALQTVKANGTVSLLKDPATGIAYVQSGGAAPLQITRADSYWSGAVPLTRGGATLVSAGVDGSGRLRVLDTSSYGQFGWVLDGSGKFTGEQKYDASTLPAAETLFAVDLNNDGSIGPRTAPPSGANGGSSGATPIVAAGSFPVALVNKTNGVWRDDQIFVTIIGQATPGVWSWVDASGIAHPLDHTAANAPDRLTKNGVGYANMAFTVAQAANLRIPPELQGGRVFVSVGQPLYIAVSPDDRGWAGPNPTYTGDPNYNTVFDWYELTYSYGKIPFGGNTTQVDQFGLPMSVTVEQTASGYSSTRGLNASRAQLLAGFAQNAPAAFQPLVVKDPAGNPLRIVAPRTAAGGALNTWLDPAVDDFWTKYKSQRFSFTGGGYSVTGTVDANDQFVYTLTSGGVSTNYALRKPTSAEIFACAGPFSGPGLQGAFLAELSAAFNRGVADNPQVWGTPSAYYPAGKRWNAFAKLFHDFGVDRYAYGFPYDDVTSQSSVQILGNAQPPSKLTISVGW